MHQASISLPDRPYTHRTLIDALAVAATAHGDQQIVHVSPTDSGEDVQTYSALADESRAVARTMVERGWRPGDPLIFVASRSRAFIDLFWGCLLSRVVPIPLSPLVTAGTDSLEADKIRGVARLTGAPILADSRLDKHAAVLEAIAGEAGTSVVYADEIIRDALLDPRPDTPLPPVDENDLVVLQFSSGSCGMPKGVRLTHRNIIANIEGQIAATDVSREDVLCTWLPYFHDFGLFWGHLSALYLGMKQVRLDPGHFARRPLVWLEKMEAHRATITNTTPTALNHLLGYIDLKQRKGAVDPFDLSGLRTMLVGAEMIDPDDCRRAVKLLAPFGVKDTVMVGGYGLTETTVAATCCLPGAPLRTRTLDRTALVAEGRAVDVPAGHPRAAEFASVGRAVPHCDIRVVDDNGVPVGPDRLGIVEIRGDNVTAGYFDNPEADQAVFLHGDWLSSGDVGFLDHDGFLTITGRAREMIIIGGHNYYPWDIEQIVLKTGAASSSLRHATICGVWNPELHREEVVLFFVPGRVNEDDMTACLAEASRRVNATAGFPIDSFVRLQMRDIPRTSSGKVMRRVLVDRLLDGTFPRLAAPKAAEDATATAAGAGTARRRHPDEIRTLLQSVWSDVLGLPVGDIGPDTSLFHLGCNSLRASEIQGRLEEALGQRLETNFNYAHPVLEKQVAQLVARDPATEAPRDEIEMILRTVSADVLDVPEHEISVTQPLAALTTGLSGALRLVAEIGRVFDLDEDRTGRLSGGTIRELAADIRTAIGLGRDRPDTGFPLMNFQETLYFHRKGFVRNEPSKLSCFIFIALELYRRDGGDLDKSALETAFDRVIARHPMLRAVIDENHDRPHMRILDDVPPFTVAFHDLSDRSPDEADAFLNRRGRDLNDVRFDIGAWPLFLCEVYRRPDGRYAFLFNIDHLLIDGYSFMHLLQDVFMAYDHAVGGRSHAVSSTGLGFGDYVLIEQARQRTRSYQRALERQLSLFENLPPKALLPFKADPATIEDVRFDTHYQMLDPCLVATLTRRAAAQGVTLNSLLLAVWFKIVNLWSGQDDLVINMPVFNREQYFADARSVIGTFIDIFPVRVRTGASDPVLEIARKVETFTRELLSVPVSSIELSRHIARRDQSASGSMSSLIFSNSIGVYGGALDTLDHLAVGKPFFRTGAPGTFIDLVLYDFEGEYYINWNYIRDLVDTDFIRRLADQFHDFCVAVAEPDASPEQVFDVQRAIPADFRRTLEQINATETPFPNATIQDLVAAQAARTPEAIAVTDGDEQVTYRALMERANQVAHLLRELGVGRDRVGQAARLREADGVGEAPFVAIVFERCVDMLVAQLGVLQAGGAYVPVDPEYPRERLAYVIDDCQATVLLTRAHLLDRLPETAARLRTVVVTDGPGAGLRAPEHLRLLGRETIDTLPTVPPDDPAGPDDLAYMIYTSGSTGQPKGVMIPHRGIVNFLDWVRTFHDLSDKDDVALVTSYAFDMTLATNWTPLMCGARIHILHESRTRDVETLLRFISDRHITFLNVTPSHFSLIANAREHLDLGDLPMVPDMRIMLGGEVINTQDLNTWLRHYPGHVFVNEYGPTEVSVATTAFTIPVDVNGRVTMTTVPIGTPLNNCRAYVLSPCGQPCLPGVAGELCLGGVGVALGYFNKPERTIPAFVPDPFVGGDARMYKTGDLARIRPDGTIEFLGRQDYQINLRGYRIEAGEVENALMLHPAVSQAVVVAQPDHNGQPQLIGYVVGPEPVSHEDLRAFLADHLPAYMIPAQTVVLDRLPTTPSGKLDRKALPVVRGLAGQAVAVGRAAVTGTEIAVQAIWKEVLGFEAIGLDQSFWDLGGDSLRAMRLIIRYREAGFTSFGLKDVFRCETIAETARYIDSAAIEAATAPAAANADTGLVSVIRDSEAPRCRLLLLPYACGNASSFMDLSRLLPSNIAVLAVSPPESWTDDAPTIEDMARRVLAALPEDETGVPLVVAGYSFGGVLACDLVRQLEQAGRPPRGLAVIATAPPGAEGEIDLILKADDAAILHYSRTVYGFDPATLTDAELARYLRQLRAQTAAIGRYRFRPDAPLKTPALALVGADEEDEELRHSLAMWGQVFTCGSSDVLPGRHMLIKTHTAGLATRLLAFIDSLPLKAAPVAVRGVAAE